MFCCFPLISCHTLNFSHRLFLQTIGSRSYFQQVWIKGLCAYLWRDWNKVFSWLLEFRQCTSSSNILNFGPWSLLQIRGSWEYLQRVFIWWLEKGVWLFIWLQTSTLDQNKVFSPWFEFFCPYTWIYILCYIHLCP